MDYNFDYNPDVGLKAHCNIVTEINGDNVTFIGGNLGDSVKQETTTLGDIRANPAYFGFITCDYGEEGPLTPPTYSPLALNVPAQLPTATVGKPYSYAFPAPSGGKQPYAYEASGGLPGGLSMSGKGAITGTPTTSGTFSFDVCVTECRGERICKPTSIEVTSNTKGSIAITSLKCNVLSRDGEKGTPLYGWGVVQYVVTGTASGPVDSSFDLPYWWPEDFDNCGSWVAQGGGGTLCVREDGFPETTSWSVETQPTYIFIPTQSFRVIVTLHKSGESDTKTAVCE
ncbi:MAG: putative Ig domain-containing protein [Candidatus Diapherotrites archaeon]|nr:putative Ig domain-containing protein [Candidatus Diapherotrites archaeon]